MVQTGVNYWTWVGQVRMYSGANAEIKNIKEITMSNTTLAPFKKFNRHIEKINKSFSSFKSYARNQEKNLTQVGTNKVTVDAQGAADLRG